jgi:hypothetical protein
MIPFEIPPEREGMTKAQLRKLVVGMADFLLSRSSETVPHPLEEAVQDRMEDGLSKVQETRLETPRWRPGQISGHLTSRQGIQQNVTKLTEDERREITEDDPTLLDNAGK